MKDREKISQLAHQHIDEVGRKKVVDRQLYSQDVLQNLSGRSEYLVSAVELQERADGYIRQLGSDMKSDETDPKKILSDLTGRSLNSLSDRLQNIRKEGESPRIFIALAGPGGAGKDTVFDNATEYLEVEGTKIARIQKYTTRDSSRPGAYHFKSDITDLHETFGDIAVTPEETDRIKEQFGINISENKVTLNQLKHIQEIVDSEAGAYTEWNPQIDINRSDLVEFLYRRNRGWYATDGNEILNSLDDNDIAVITGNPQNLVKMMDWIILRGKNIIPLMVYVMPAYPSQFTSAARALARDGIDQDDKTLLSTTGPRQTDEMKALTELLEQKSLSSHDLVILENDSLLSDPEISGKVETAAGLKLGKAITGKN